MIVSFQNPEQKLTKFANFWNSRREFNNSREFPREFLRWRIPGNSRTGIPGGPDPIVSYLYQLNNEICCPAHNMTIQSNPIFSYQIPLPEAQNATN